MAHYRIYALDPTDHIRAASDSECEDDEAALAQATTIFPRAYAVEIWTGDRCVCRVSGAVSAERSAAD
jgi:hypothetical protein